MRPITAAYRKYKKRYPDLDESSFTWGYVACINDIYAGKYKQKPKTRRTKKK